MKWYLGLLAAAVCSTSAAADFQIKGRKLGDRQETACSGSPIVNHQQLVDATGASGLEFPAANCDVLIDTLAHLTPSAPAILLFWKGALVRMIVNFERLELADAAALRSTFTQMHGKPVTKRNPPFSADYWHAKKQTLMIEWTSGLPTSAGVFLTDDKGWAEYERSRDRVDKAMKQQRARLRAQDVSN